MVTQAPRGGEALVRSPETAANGYTGANGAPLSLRLFWRIRRFLQGKPQIHPDLDITGFPLSAAYSALDKNPWNPSKE
jgi:hypothetical protein